MTSTPDSVSTSDLMAFSDAALAREAEDAKKMEGPYPNGLSQKEYYDTVCEKLAELHDSLCHPMFAKIVSLEMMNKLVEWHTERGKEEFAEGDTDCGACWLRDGGKLQAAMQSLVSVQLPDDFIHED